MADQTTESQSDIGSTEHKHRILEGKDSGKIGTWLVTLLLAFLYIAAGVPKLGGLDLMIHRFEAWGYPDWFRMGVGGFEFVAGIFLIIPRFTFWAATGLSLLMVGAAYTHLARGTAGLALVPMAALGMLMWLAYKRRDQAIGLESRGDVPTGMKAA